MKYGIDMVDEWGNSPEWLRDMRCFDELPDAILWGESHIFEDSHSCYGFFIFEIKTEKVAYHSFQGGPPDIIDSRFEILDL